MAPPGLQEGRLRVVWDNAACGRVGRCGELDLLLPFGRGEDAAAGAVEVVREIRGDSGLFPEECEGGRVSCVVERFGDCCFEGLYCEWGYLYCLRDGTKVLFPGQ